MLALLTDQTRCQVMLVTLPEETPVNELVETAYLASLSDETPEGKSIVELARRERFTVTSP